MKTELLLASQPQDVRRAAELLKAGELVALPTETVYGLAADASNSAAVAKIFAAKQRPTNHPLITHMASIAQLPRWAASVPDWVESVAQQFWPGPLTLVLEKHPTVSDVITGGLNTIGLRVPNQTVLTAMLNEFDLAVAAPSANLYQKLSPTSAQQVMDGLGGKIAAVLDGGPCGVGSESTILKVTGNKAEILRSGPISAADLQPYLPMPVTTPRSHQQAVSGNKKVHYQPDALVLLKQGEDIMALLDKTDSDTGFICFSAQFAGKNQANLILLPDDHRAYRQALYAQLYQLSQRVSTIVVEIPPQRAEWLDIHDRLNRAAAD